MINGVSPGLSDCTLLWLMILWLAWIQAVKIQMSAEGLDASLLDTPDAPSS
jgi:hypothetical protein